MSLYGIVLALSMSHLVVVAVILLLLFGGKKIPELMKGLGSGIKQFKDAIKEDENKNSPENDTENEKK